MIDGFEEKFGSFLEGCKQIVAEDHAKKYANLRQPWLEVVPAKANTRYIAIRSYDDWNKEACALNGGKDKGIRWRAYAFVDTTNGDVLKPATWRAPAKHSRGNIFDPSNGLAKMGPFGPAYLT